MLEGFQGKAVAVQPSPVPITPAGEADGPKPGAGSPAALRLCSCSLSKGDNTSQGRFCPGFASELGFSGPRAWLMALLSVRVSCGGCQRGQQWMGTAVKGTAMDGVWVLGLGGGRLASSSG